MNKENIVKEFIAAELSLPLSFMQDKADLYTLSMLSNYFKKIDNEKMITESDIDLEKLNLSAFDLPYEADKKGFRLSLLPLLKDEIKFPLNTKIPAYEESFSHDRVPNYTIGLVCLMMTLEQSFVNCNIPDSEAELCNTVEDLVKAVLRTAEITV